jgi:2-amino-4-hydroxy-6-hydroxymethyldihydropteridine diphosphokinase
VTISAVSRLYETGPAYVLNQPVFLNIVVEGETELSPGDLLVYLKQLEKKMGREKTLRYGPRKIDLDIVFYDDLVLDIPGLTIPHPRMHERGFVLRPLADIAPAIVHPILKRSVAELLAGLLDDGASWDDVLKVVEWQPFSD